MRLQQASTLAKSANDIMPGMILVFSEGGTMPRMVAKYRPCVPVMVVTSNQELSRHCQAMFGLYTMLLDKPVASVKAMKETVTMALRHARDVGLCMPGKEVVVFISSRIARPQQSSEAAERQMYITTCPGSLSRLGSMQPVQSGTDGAGLNVAKTLSLRSTIIDLPMLFESSTPVRKTKIIATMGPSCSTAEMIGRLLDAGMDIARFNMAMMNMAEIRPIVKLLREVGALPRPGIRHACCKPARRLHARARPSETRRQSAAADSQPARLPGVQAKEEDLRNPRGHARPRDPDVLSCGWA